MTLPPLVEPAPSLTDAERERYARSMVLPQIGDIGQRRLKNARVLVLGAGGIGSPVIAYLAAAGVGRIGVVDADRVDVSNLHRQLAHGPSDVGRSKAESAAESIRAANPLVEAVAIDESFDAESAERIMTGWDLVVDGFDTFGSRYLASDTAETLGIPHVWGSALGLDGQLSVFWAAAPGGGVTLRDLHAAAPDEGDTCASVGVSGPLCGTIGTMLASEVVKLVVGFGETLLGRVVVFDAADASWAELPLGIRPLSAAEAHPSAPLDGSDAAAPVDVGITTTSELLAGLATETPPVVLDIRETTEPRDVLIEGAIWIPQSVLRLDELWLDVDTEIVVACASGVRSRAVATSLVAAGWTRATSLRGGALAWSLTGA